jgi:rhodanese-related sulfurtransferase
LGWVLRSMIKYWRQTIQVFRHAFREENPKWTEITVDELFDRMDSNPPDLLIDVRSVEEYSGKYGHIPNAKLIPMLELESRLDELEEFREKEIVTMCPGGGLSLVAVDIMTEVGFKDVKSLKGGTDEWNQKGYPLTIN